MGKAKYLILALALCWALPAYAEQPLLQEGKRTVYQRVVSHPGATMYADESAGQEIGKPLTFTSFYVYEDKGDMLRVGRSASESDGWLKKSDVTVWPQAITMVFAKQMGRSPALFYRDHNTLVELCEADNIAGKVADYEKKFESGAKDSPVIAMEPGEKEGTISQKSFYLLPVLNMDDQFKEGGTQLIEVACIDPGNSDGRKPDKAGGKKMTTGIVFVLDTTKSMGAYVEKSKDIVRKTLSELKSSPAKDNVKFAVVAFRRNPSLAPKTQYNTKIISDFMSADESDKMERALKGAAETSESTGPGWDEDSLAGVQEAIESLSWDGIDSRAMLLVTDAGPLAPDDPAGSTGMTPEAMAGLLKSKNIYMTVAHVKSPGGKEDHPYAEKSYRELALMGNGRSSYIPIDAPNPVAGANSFDKVGTIIAEKYRQITEMTAKGEQARKPEEQDLPESASPEEKAKQMAEAIGYAMQLQFKGDQNQTTAPHVVSAWMADADLRNLEANPDNAPVPVAWPAVLLTKSQLSQLRKQVGLIIQNAEEAFLSGNENFNFYEQLISAAAKMSSDPTAFNKDPNANLAQKGVLLEVLDGLPYKSQILRMQQEDWTNMSTGEQQEFIKRLKGLLKLYDKLDGSDNWEGFGSQKSNEWVTRVPLSQLP